MVHTAQQLHIPIYYNSTVCLQLVHSAIETLEKKLAEQNKQSTEHSFVPVHIDGKRTNRVEKYLQFLWPSQRTYTVHCYMPQPDIIYKTPDSLQCNVHNADNLVKIHEKESTAKGSGLIKSRVCPQQPNSPGRGEAILGTTKCTLGPPIIIGLPGHERPTSPSPPPLTKQEKKLRTWKTVSPHWKTLQLSQARDMGTCVRHSLRKLHRFPRHVWLTLAGSVPKYTDYIHSTLYQADLPIERLALLAHFSVPVLPLFRLPVRT